MKKNKIIWTFGVGNGYVISSNFHTAHTLVDVMSNWIHSFFFLNHHVFSSEFGSTLGLGTIWRKEKSTIHNIQTWTFEHVKLWNLGMILPFMTNFHVFPRFWIEQKKKIYKKIMNFSILFSSFDDFVELRQLNGIIEFRTLCNFFFRCWSTFSSTTRRIYGSNEKKKLKKKISFDIKERRKRKSTHEFVEKFYTRSEFNSGSRVCVLNI